MPIAAQAKPEMVYILERAIDAAAHELEMDPAHIRMINLIGKEDLPRLLFLGQAIDTGDFQGLLQATLERADWVGYQRRAKDAKRRGKLIGARPRAAHACYWRLHQRTFDHRNRQRWYHSRSPTGTQSGGQGHETVLAQIVAEKFEIDIDRVQIIQGDTRQLEDGGGTGGSSSLPIAGVNIQKTSTLLLEQARHAAAEKLEAATADIAYRKGQFFVAGTDRRIGLFDLADGSNLSMGCDYEGLHATIPNGCYVAEVEIDPETGTVVLTRFTGLDDLGTVLNPLIALGQIQGGAGSRDRPSHCLNRQDLTRTGNCSPAHSWTMQCQGPMICRIWIWVSGQSRQQPIRLEPREAGELGPAGALAPIVHAVLDALRSFGVKSIDMPLTSEKVWRAMREGQA